MKKFKLILFISSILFFFSQMAFAVPSPSKSQYFETVGGGLSLDKEFFYIQFVVDLKIIKSLPENAHLIAIFENPADKKKPLIKTYKVTPGQDRLLVVSDPVRDVKTRNYEVVIKVYSDEAETKLLAKHKQKIKSEVNESHVKKLLSADTKFPSYFFSYDSDGRDWETGYQARNKEQIVRELVLSGEKIENWSELATILVYFKVVDINQFVTIMQNQLAETSKDFVTKRIKNTPNDIIFEWSHKGNGKWPAQREIKRVIRTEEGVYSISYAVKETYYKKTNYNKWQEIIKLASLK